MVVDEAAQRNAKMRFVADALQRIGGLPDNVTITPIVAVSPTLGYRNKIELTFSRDRAGRRVLGYHRAGTPSELIDVDQCAIADTRLQPLLAAARAFFLEGPGLSEPAIDAARAPLRLVLRASNARDERLVAFRGLARPFPSVASFAQTAAKADPGLVGVVVLPALPGRRSGARPATIAGRSWITDEIHGTEFRVPAGTFLQIHAVAAEVVGRSVLEGAGSPRHVVELYGGIGALGIAIARAGARSTIVDADPEAIACGIDATRRAALTTVRFERADVLAFLEARHEAHPPDLVIVDPPRTGLGRGVATRLAALRASRIAMISCDPATLARDLGALIASGYTMERLTPFDIFPQTAHVESLAWLSRTAAPMP